MVNRIDTPKEVKNEDEIPVVPNYLDLLLGEVNAIRLLLEKQTPKD